MQGKDFLINYTLIVFSIGCMLMGLDGQTSIYIPLAFTFLLFGATKLGYDHGRAQQVDHVVNGDLVPKEGD